MRHPSSLAVALRLVRTLPDVGDACDQLRQGQCLRLRPHNDDEQGCACMCHHRCTYASAQSKTRTTDCACCTFGRRTCDFVGELRERDEQGCPQVRPGRTHAHSRPHRAAAVSDVLAGQCQRRQKVVRAQLAQACLDGPRQADQVDLLYARTRVNRRVRARPGPFSACTRVRANELDRNTPTQADACMGLLCMDAVPA